MKPGEKYAFFFLLEVVCMPEIVLTKRKSPILFLHYFNKIRNKRKILVRTNGFTMH